jgi:anti-sigma-K factor RskA
MVDDDLDALAAEYVLGTLGADERSNAEALLVVDPGFVEIVRQWERRLGELNVMVEAVEPPPQVWEKIKSQVTSLARSDDVRLVPSQPPTPAPKAEPETRTETKAETAGAADHSPLLAALATSLRSPETPTEAESEPAEHTVRPTLPLVPPKLERDADIVDLSRRASRWRNTALVMTALAALLAVFIVVSQVNPGLIPEGGFRLPQLIAHSPAPSSSPSEGSRFVAVLEQDPGSPGFLLTVDPASQSLTVRRLATAAGATHSYELWLISPQAPKPRSLGVVGAEEFTRQPLPSGLDVDALRSATYKISFEPAGGSKTGAPTGPILFSGKLVEAVPAATPRT